MRPTFPPSPEFEKIVRGDPRARLARAALEIARDVDPELCIEAYLDRIDRIALRVRDRIRPNAPPLNAVQQINWALFVEERFRGDRDDYYDPRNSYLNEVLDRKTGIPISLSVLYGAVAERLGVRLSGANLPAHFMLRLDDRADDGPRFIDPFHDGEILDLDACRNRLSRIIGKPTTLSEAQVSPCSPREVVARMLRNLKAIYLGAEDYSEALVVQRRLAVAAADDPTERRDLGMLCLRLDRPGEAVDPLTDYLNSCPDAADAPIVLDLLATARSLVARWN